MIFKEIFLKVFSFLSKFIPSGLPLIVLKGPLKGIKWIAGAGEGSAKGLSVLLNLSEPEQFNTAKSLIPKTGICFDIGANVGLYTLLFSKYSKFVYAFEPLPRNISYLYRTLALNNAVNVLVVPYAVSEENGFAWFQEGEHTSEGKLDKKGTQPVAVISLDYFIEKIKKYPQILKIDVEGAELDVLKGANNLLSNQKPIILLSTHGDQLKTKCIEYLKKLNYQQFIPINASTIKEASELLIKP